MLITVFDITELIRTDVAVTTSTTLATLKTHLQSGRTHDCPKCGATGAIDGPESDTRLPCDVCEGFGKTVAAWEAYTLETGYRIIP